MPEPICLLCELPGDECECEPNGIFDPADLQQLEDEDYDPRTLDEIVGVEFETQKKERR
jgi:hypothetical protein